MEALSVSVVVTTYNSPEALRLVMAGLQRQVHRPLEVLVADDGSGPETRTAVEEMAAAAPYPVRHVWQEDRGFRKCHILNRGVRAARGNYVVFLDGDCVPTKHLVASHVRAARRGRFVAGGKVLLSERFTQQLKVEDVVAGKLDRPGLWWFETGRSRRLFLRALPLVARVMDLCTTGWRGENSSTFRDHIERVNGFDQRFTYLYDDADFGSRLEASGIRRRSIRYSCPVFHLEHARPWYDPEQVKRNLALYESNVAAGMTATPYGMDTLDSETESGTR